MGIFPVPENPLTRTMCKIMGFDIQERVHETSNFDWIANRGMIKIHSLDDEVSVFLCTGGGQTHLEHIKSVGQVQGLYYYLHNEKI